MDELVLAVPGDPATRTGGYLYDARIVAELNARGHRASMLSLPAEFPFPAPRSVAEALRQLSGAPRGATLVVDGLAYGALPVDGILALGRAVVALVHHPLAMETGLTPEVAARLEASERAALAVAAAVVTTSAATRGILVERYGLSPGRIHVAEPGVDPAERARGSGGDPVILTVGTVTPRKNHLALAEALGRIMDSCWRWRVVGSLERDPDTAARLRAAIMAAGVADRAELLGEIDEDALRDAYASADLFALPSLFEGYGMAHAEALARGLPVIAGEGAAASRLVPAGAGQLVPPEDIEALSAALRRWISDPLARRTAADAAWAHAEKLPRWGAAADAFERVMAEVGRGAHAA